MSTKVMTDPVLVITSLGKRFSFDAPWALKDVSLSVDSGQVVVLLGQSGSGKSTLLRHINALEEPTEGGVSVLGHEVASLQGKTLRELRASIGFIFQRFELVGPLTAEENVLTGASARVRGPRLGAWMYPKALRAEAMDQLERVGLASFAGRRSDTLSGGQQQRVAIARALMQRPSILLADEPVASLDPESSDEVMTLIRQIADRDHLTVVCSLHNVDLALHWGDRIIGLRQGSVVLDSPAANLTSEQVIPLYQKPVPDTPEQLMRPGLVALRS